MNSGTISTSTIFKTAIYHINTASIGDKPYLTIREDNIEIDFNNSVLDGRSVKTLPDSFSGIAILIKDCKNVTIKNVNIHGFKIAILAENVQNLKIISSNLSYNYRPRLHSKWDREALSDWLYFHQNENEEWKNYGAAIYLHHCDHALIKDIVCHQGMNGLLMVRCKEALVYNNDIRFNSGLGIGLYRSGYNRIMHNKLDWNARGYSHGKYERGQDSAAILLYEQSSHNTIAFNSGTHSGDGLFLWAGQHTMDTGLGGCDSNMIYQNDFSHSIANGIEVTFSANYMIENILNDCNYGIWGGYSHHSIIRGNEIKNCKTGIAIEHGRYIVIEDNQIADAKTGVQLWARTSQPSDWPYAQKINVASRQYRLANNHFDTINDAVEVSLTDSVWMSDNIYSDVMNRTSTPKGSSFFIEGDQKQPWMNADVTLPEHLEDGQSTTLSSGTLRGRKYIIVNEWGPYDFQYPLLALRRKEQTASNDVLYFDIYGPGGKWKLDSIEGCVLNDHISGSIPDSIIVHCPLDSMRRNMGLSFSGEQVVTQFGDTIPAQTRYPFQYSEFSIRTNWDLSFFTYDSLSDPLHFPLAFQKVLNENPLKTMTADQLAYRWWDKPNTDVPADHFAIKASSSFHIPAGKYILQVESDDGIRVWLDDKLVLDRWDIHTPAVDEVNIEPSEGIHSLQIEYFEATGLAVLDIVISQVK